MPETFAEMAATLSSQAVQFIPHLIGATLILVIGLIAGKFVAHVVREILIAVKADAYVKHRKAGIAKPTSIVSTIFKWWIYLIFIQSAVEYLGIPALSFYLGQVLGFIPNLIAAGVIIIVGYVIADYFQDHIEASNAAHSKLVAKIVFVFTLYLAVAMALEQVRIVPTLVNSILLIIVGSLGVGFAIALGLGLKDAINVEAMKYVKKRG